MKAILKLFTYFFRLIRWKNLGIICITQLLIWYCVIYTMKQSFGIPIFLNFTNFILICMSTLMIAASGYIINDYFDVKIDLRNRPHKVIIGRIIKKRWAMACHTAFNIFGFIIGLYLALQIGHPSLVLIQLISTILLWVYSTHLKRMFISGNIIVALLTGLALVTVLAYEPSLYEYIEQKAILIIQHKLIINPFWIIAIYTFFAFFLTWMREIVKDMEDFKGDKEEGCVTMPIKIGLQKTNYFVIFLGTITLIPLLYSSARLLTTEWYAMGIYILAALIMPILYIMVLLPRKHTMKHYGKISLYLKIVMLLGVLSLVLYRYLINN